MNHVGVRWGFTVLAHASFGLFQRDRRLVEDGDEFWHACCKEIWANWGVRSLAMKRFFLRFALAAILTLVVGAGVGVGSAAKRDGQIPASLERPRRKRLSHLSAIL